MTFDVTWRATSVARYLARFASRARSTMSAATQLTAASSRTSRAAWSWAVSSPMWRCTVGSCATATFSGRGYAASVRGHERLEEGLAHVGLAVERAPDHVVGRAERHRAEVLQAVDHPVVAGPPDRGLHEEGAREAHRGLAAPAPEELAE